VKLKDKLLAHLKTRKTPMTAGMIAERFGCTNKTALDAMQSLVKEGAVQQVLVANQNRYVKGVRT
jgi:predicted ArsR family transcriptional regulator